MILSEFRTYFNEQLSNVFPKTEVDTFFFLLTEEILKLQRIDVALNPRFKISESDIITLKKALSKLQNQEPIQYILGNTEFYGLPFKVNKHTLIPRPETEELVAWIISDLKDKSIVTSNGVEKSLNILEIGTGTGCIPITLAKNIPNATITSIDISSEALIIAKENAKLNDVHINFIEQNILTTKNLNVIANKMKQSQNNDKITSSQTPHNYIQFDIIVSNPPYVRNLEKVEIQPNVLENEPHLALFVEDNNPLLFYKNIAELAQNYLKENGSLFFEINQYLGKETIEMLTEKGFYSVLRKDIFGNDRMTKSVFKS